MSVKSDASTFTKEDLDAIKGTRLELRIIPDETTKTFGVELQAKSLTEDNAQHLASHLASAMEEFLECVGATGFKLLGTTDVATGEHKVLQATSFTSEAAMKPIDPKTVN